MAEKMIVTLAERRHPVSPCHESIVQRSAQDEKLSIHYQDTITTVFRTITSVNQLSFYGAGAEMCEEYESFHDRTGKPVIGGQSSSSFVPSVIKTNLSLNSERSCSQRSLFCRNTENELKSYHNQKDRMSKFCMDA